MLTFSPLPFILSLLTYILLCVISICWGMAALSWFRVALPLPLRLALSPAFALAMWTLAVSFSQATGHTVRDIAPVLWIIGILACAIRPISRYLPRPFSWDAFIAPVSPIIAMWPAFWGGITNYQTTYAPDAWNYVVLGQYLWANPKVVAKGSLSPLYHYIQAYV